MPIDQKIKDAVRARLLAELSEYFERAEKSENEVFHHETDAADRFDDFVVGLAIKLDHEVDGHGKMRPATTFQIHQAVRAYKEGVLSDKRFDKGYRPFVKDDVKNVVMALNLRNLEVSEAAVQEAAEQMGLT